MHDNQLQNLSGWPDVESAPSVVRCVKQSLSVATPFGVGVNWDCHIVGWPFLNKMPFSGTAGRSNNFFTAAQVVTSNLGGVQVYATPAGGDFNIALNLLGTIEIAQQFSRGTGRLIGMGIEVTNTTSDLNRQGLVTVYRQPQAHVTQSAYTAVAPAGDVRASVTLQPVRFPPPNVANAMLFPGSRQWKAAEGCYLVSSFLGSTNPPNMVGFIEPVLFGNSTGGNDDSTNGGLNSGAMQFPTPTTQVVGPNSFFSFPPTKLYPIHTSGAIFSGLSSPTTLSINVNIYYESFPAIDEADILVLSTPSCSYDPVALEILSHVMNVMPVGVPAAMNAAGDWFADLVDMVAEWAPIIGTAMSGVGVPFAAPIGQGLGSMASLGQRYLTPPGSTTIAPKVNSLGAANMKAKKGKAVARAAANAANNNPRKTQQKAKAKSKAKQGGR